MSFLWTLIQFIVVLGLLLFVHEFGHFTVSRLFKIEVEEFGFGLPPRIVKLFNWQGTDFTLNWIPFGAFVRPKGEADPTVKGGMAAANPWKRLLILLGGPAANILVGIIILGVMYMIIGKSNTSLVEVIDVTAGTPAAQVGLKSGDIVLKVNNDTIDSIEKLQNEVHSYLGKSITLTIERNHQDLTIEVTPRANPPAGQGSLGITLSNPYESISFGESWGSAFSSAYNQAEQLVLLPVNLIKGTISSDQARLVGIKGIYDIYSQADQMDAESSSTSSSTQGLPIFRLSFVATIAIAIGLTNLLPVPALDGGRIILLIPELFFRKRVPIKYENALNMIGFSLLLFLMFYITIQDFINPVISH